MSFEARDLNGTSEMFYLEELGYNPSKKAVRDFLSKKLNIKYFDVNYEEPIMNGSVVEVVYISEDMLIEAIIYNEVERFIELESICPITNENICDTIVKYNNLELLDYAIIRFFPMSANLCFLAAECGHLEILQKLLSIGYDWNIGICTSAAKNGQLNILQWAEHNNYRWSREECLRHSIYHPKVQFWIYNL